MKLNKIASYGETSDAKSYLAAIEARVEAGRHFVQSPVAAPAVSAPAPMHGL